MMDGNGSGLETLGDVSNAGKRQILFEAPYAVTFVAEGTAPMLFHAWSVEGVEAKGKARKGSRAKKEDDVESYVYRDPTTRELAVPGEYFRQAMIHAAKFQQDPRSPRKSAMDLFKAGIAPLTHLCLLGTTDWDYLDRRRVTVQRSGITRIRPAMHLGWRTTCAMQVLLPEYIQPALFQEVLVMAGRIVGVGDNRPSFGRFRITAFDLTTD